MWLFAFSEHFRILSDEVIHSYSSWSLLPLRMAVVPRIITLHRGARTCQLHVQQLVCNFEVVEKN